MEIMYNIHTGLVTGATITYFVTWNINTKSKTKFIQYYIDQFYFYTIFVLNKAGFWS